MLIPHAYSSPALLASARPLACPIDLSNPTIDARAEGADREACGLLPAIWDLADMQAVHASTASRLTNGVRWLAGANDHGQTHADAPLRTAHDAGALHARGELARGALKQYAQAFQASRAQGEPSWMGRLAQGKLDVVLSSPTHFAPVVTQAHDDASLAQASVVPLPQRGALVIDADRFFSVGNNGAVLPSKAARRDMQALFIHARCHEMLKPLARALSLGVDEVERRIDQQIRGVNKTDPQAWAKVIDALRAGDEAGVVKAFIRPAVVQTLRTSPIMPRRLDSRGDGVSDGACQELLNVASDILTFEPPRMARSQQLRKLLAADAGRLALEGFINRNIAALRMLMAAYSTAVANDAIRRKLEVVVGDFDLLATQNVLLAFQDAGSMAAMRATVPGAEAGMLLREEPIHLGEQVARSYLSSESTAAPPAPDRRDQPIYLQLQIHPLTSDNLEYAFIVHELLHGYHDGGVVGASRAINKALGLATPEYGAKFLYEYVVDYLQWEITGKPPKTYAPRALSVRCVLVARTDLENRSYDQCEAAVLGLVFNPQPTWGHLELAALERLTRSLHAQHQIDKHSLSDPRQRVAQHIVGYPSHDKPVLEVTVLGRQGDGFLVKPKGSLPTPLPEGMTKIREGVFHVKAEKLASRVVGT